MSAQSGITVNPETLEVFADASAEDSDCLLLKVVIENNEDFSVTDRADMTGDRITDWQAAANCLDGKNPCYILFNPASDDGKWIVIAWVPPKCKPTLKMLYASSRASLKEGLGRTKFGEDYFVNSQDECSYDAFMDHSEHTEEKDSVRTWEENLKRQAAMDAAHAGTSVKQSAMATLDIPVSAGAQSAFEAIKSGNKNCALLLLTEGEEMDVESTSNCEVQDIAGKLSPKDPRFIIFNFDHTHEGTRSEKLVFIYYCPEAAHPKSKMFYSASVQNMNDLCAQYGLNIERKIEISDPADSGQENLRYELYPKEVKKERFAKPAARGRRARGRGGARKKWTGS